MTKSKVLFVAMYNRILVGLSVALFVLLVGIGLLMDGFLTNFDIENIWYFSNR